MAQVKGSKLYNQFVRGLITEATALTFPENASYDEQNFKLLRNGSRVRRKGIKKSDEPATVDAATYGIEDEHIQDQNITLYKWSSAGGDGNYNFLVAQIGPQVFFWDDEQIRPEVIDLDTYALDNKNPGLSQCQFASGKGLLFIANAVVTPLYITYDIAADTLTETPIPIKIRDFEGLDDGYSVNVRPTVLSTEHRYNLQNQGWVDGAVSIRTAVAGVSEPEDPIIAFFQYTDTYTI